ncbi:hypothetical protein G9A89_009306 [Geosiphon pyriformis]|nr:hypothetical protein G9A89_009306 [Geosiphon pyriformis]
MTVVSGKKPLNVTTAINVKSSFAGSKFYAKAVASVVFSVVAATDVNLDLGGFLKAAPLMFELSLLIKSLVESVSSLVVLVTKLLSIPSVIDVLVKESVNVLANQIKDFCAVTSIMQKDIVMALANAEEDNTSFTIQFEMKFRTPILISKWHMELEKRTQGPDEAVTKYAKAIRNLIKQVDFERNWTKEQKTYSFTKKLRTDFLYALWPLLALKNNFTMDMAVELTQQIKDNQRMHLGSTFLVFALASVMVSAPQMAAISFTAQTPDPNEQLINRLIANLA